MSSAKFLVQNGFDFNKVFSQGIPFLTWDQERHCRNRLGRKRKDELCEEDEKFLALIYEKINVWLQNGTGDLKMDELDGYQRRLIAANAPEKYNFFIKAIQKNGTLSIVKLTEEDKRAAQATLASLESEIDKNIGFRAIIDLIIESQKIIVGHNMLLDTCHMYQKFCATLPEELEEFKKKIHTLFPFLVDTKYLAKKNEDFKDTSTQLQSLYTSLEAMDKSISITEENGFGVTGLNCHNAAYDSFITGVSFIRLISMLHKESFSSEGKLKEIISSENVLNKLYIMESDIEYFDIVNEEVVPDRSHIVYMYDFDKSWNTMKLKNIADKHGDPFIKWIDDSSVLIIFSDAKKADNFISQSAKEYKVMSYSAYDSGRKSPKKSRISD